MSGNPWQPIHTAPDLETVDLYTDWAGVRDVDCHFNGAEWVTWNGDKQEIVYPTHWMPRPPNPPTSVAEKG